MFRKSIVLVVVMSVLVLTMGLAQAQEMPPLPGEEVLSDLGAVRGIAFDDEGTLYVADAGSGGEVELTIPGPEGEGTANVGLTGKVITVAPDGTASDMIPAMPSFTFAEQGETLGIYRAIPRGDSLWVIASGTGPGTFGVYYTDNVVKIDRETLATEEIINLNNFEAENDPDGRGYDSNVADIAWAEDGTMYIVDAGMNSLLSWTEADGLQLINAWGNDVPDSIEVADNGDIYIGFLGEGIAPGAAKIEHWSGGEVVETFEGLTAVTDILLDGETLYAVQMFLFGEQGPGPGNVVTVTADGATPVVEGLMTPFGLAMSPDGELYVSWGTLPLQPGVKGGVIKVAP